MISRFVSGVLSRFNRRFKHRFTRGKFLLLLIVSGGIVAVISSIDRPVVFINARIMTMNPSDTVESAIGMARGRIVAVGGDEEVAADMVSRLRDEPWYVALIKPRTIDLKGKTVLPGFVDAHSHFPASGLVGAGIDLSSPPFGTVPDIQSLTHRIKQQASTQSARRWIVGFDYDNALLDDKRHPSRQELDSAAPEHPVYIRHRSGHMGVANTRALQLLGIESHTGLLQADAAIGMQTKQRCSFCA